jgi:hypothetical protein
MSTTIWPIVPAPDDDDDDDESGEVGGMRNIRDTELLGENLLQCHYVHHKSYTT